MGMWRTWGMLDWRAASTRDEFVASWNVVATRYARKSYDPPTSRPLAALMPDLNSSSYTTTA